MSFVTASQCRSISSRRVRSMARPWRRSSTRGALCLVDAAGDGAWLLPKPGVFDGVRALDGAWLEHALRDVDVDVTYQHGVDRVLDAVRSGAAAAGVLIRPVSVAEIERTARGRAVDAAQVDVLHAEAAHRPRGAPADVRTRTPSVRRC